MKRQIRMRRLPDERAFQPLPAAALELLHRLVDVVHRDRRDADEAVRRDAAVLEQPIVVDAKAGLLQPRVREREKAEHQRGVEHLRAQAIDFHLLDARVRIVAAGALLEALAELVRRKERRRVAALRRHARLPQVDRLHHAGVGRDDEVGHSKYSPSRYTTGTRLFSFESPGMGSPQILSRARGSWPPARQPMRSRTSGSSLIVSNQ